MSKRVPALRHAFKELRPQRRREIHEPVERLNRLRNRIAHHEPIYRRDLAKDHADALKVLAAICPLTQVLGSSNQRRSGNVGSSPAYPHTAEAVIDVRKTVGWGEGVGE